MKITDIHNEIIKPLDAMKSVSFDEETQNIGLGNVLGNVSTPRGGNAAKLTRYLRRTPVQDIELENVKTNAISNMESRCAHVMIAGDIKFTVDGDEYEGYVVLAYRTADNSGIPVNKYAYLAAVLKMGDVIEVTSQIADSWGDFDYRHNFFTMNDTTLPVQIMVSIFSAVDEYVGGALPKAMYDKVAARSPYGDMKSLTCKAEITGIYPAAEKYLELDELWKNELPEYDKKKFRIAFAGHAGWSIPVIVTAAHKRGIAYDTVLAAIDKPHGEVNPNRSYGWVLGNGEGEWEDMVDLYEGMSDKMFKKMLKILSELDNREWARITSRMEARIGTFAGTRYNYSKTHHEEIIKVAKELIGGVEFTTAHEMMERLESAARAYSSAIEEIVNREEMAKPVSQDTPYAKVFKCFPQTVEVDGEKYDVRPAETAGDLKKWGRQMENCIGSYSSNAVNGSRGYLGIYKHDAAEPCKLENLVGNIEFSQRSLNYSNSKAITISQAYGHMNNHLPSGLTDAILYAMMGAAMEEKVLVG